MSRIQLALNVDDLDASIAFYTGLFGTAPAKTKPGYANFAVAEPPLKLVLIENPGQGGSVNHLGVEVADTTTVEHDAGPARHRGPGLHGGAGHHLLLRPAGQVLGRGRAGRRALGGLHRARGQRDVLRRRRRGGLLHDRRRIEPHRGRRLLLSPAHRFAGQPSAARSRRPRGVGGSCSSRIGPASAASSPRASGCSAPRGAAGVPVAMASK